MAGFRFKMKKKRKLQAAITTIPELDKKKSDPLQVEGIDLKWWWWWCRSSGHRSSEAGQ
jgi:hypothetical protein